MLARDSKLLHPASPAQAERKGQAFAATTADTAQKGDGECTRWRCATENTGGIPHTGAFEAGNINKGLKVPTIVFKFTNDEYTLVKERQSKTLERKASRRKSLSQHK